MFPAKRYYVPLFQRTPPTPMSDIELVVNSGDKLG